jgi:hypothetical protein
MGYFAYLVSIFEDFAKGGTPDDEVLEYLKNEFNDDNKGKKYYYDYLKYKERYFYDPLEDL